MILGSKEPGHTLLLQRGSVSTASLGSPSPDEEVTLKMLLHKLLITVWCCCVDAPLHLLPDVPEHHMDLAGLVVPPKSVPLPLTEEQTAALPLL